MKNNIELKIDVQNAIKWEPLLNATEIEVTAKDGVVSLSGIVDSFAKKMEAENAAKKVGGVKALVENIEVQLPSEWCKNNVEIAKDVLIALKSNWAVPNDKVKVKVEDGWVTLEGELSCSRQIDGAKNSVNYLTGVKGVTNNIKIKSNLNDAIEQKEIERAIARSWLIDDNNIEVEVSGSIVTLSGSVTSLFQKEESNRIAWKTSGILRVRNMLVVEYENSIVG